MVFLLSILKWTSISHWVRAGHGTDRAFWGSGHWLLWNTGGSHHDPWSPGSFQTPALGSAFVSVRQEFLAERVLRPPPWGLLWLTFARPVGCTSEFCSPAKTWQSWWPSKTITVTFPFVIGRGSQEAAGKKMALWILVWLDSTHKPFFNTLTQSRTSSSSVTLQEL